MGVDVIEVTCPVLKFAPILIPQCRSRDIPRRAALVLVKSHNDFIGDGDGGGHMRL